MFDLNDMTAEMVPPSSASGLSANTVVDSLLKFGIEGLELESSNSITFNVYIGTEKNGQAYSVKRSASIDSGWSGDGLGQTECTVSDGYCTFDTEKLSYFALT